MEVGSERARWFTALRLLERMEKRRGLVPDDACYIAAIAVLGRWSVAGRDLGARTHGGGADRGRFGGGHRGDGVRGSSRAAPRGPCERVRSRHGGLREILAHTIERQRRGRRLGGEVGERRRAATARAPQRTARRRPITPHAPRGPGSGGGGGRLASIAGPAQAVCQRGAAVARRWLRASSRLRRGRAGVRRRGAATGRTGTPRQHDDAGSTGRAANSTEEAVCGATAPASARQPPIAPEPDLATFNVAISAAGVAGAWKRVLGLYRDLRRAQLTGDSTTFVALLQLSAPTVGRLSATAATANRRLRCGVAMDRSLGLEYHGFARRSAPRPGRAAVTLGDMSRRFEAKRRSAEGSSLSVPSRRGTRPWTCTAWCPRRLATSSSSREPGQPRTAWFSRLGKGSVLQPALKEAVGSLVEGSTSNCEGRQRMVVVVLMHWRPSLAQAVHDGANPGRLAPTHPLSSSCARVITGDLALQGLLLCSAMSSEVRIVRQYGFSVMGSPERIVHETPPSNPAAQVPTYHELRPIPAFHEIKANGSGICSSAADERRPGTKPQERQATTTRSSGLHIY